MRSSRGRLLSSWLLCGMQIPRWVRQESQSVEKLFLRGNHFWFLLNAFKCFVGSLLYLSSAFYLKEVFSVFLMYIIKWILYFFYHFFVYLKKHSLYSFRQAFLTTSTSKSLTQKILFSCCTVCLYGTEQSLMVKQGLDKGSATLELCKIAFFLKGHILKQNSLKLNYEQSQRQEGGGSARCLNYSASFTMQFYYC